MLFNLLWQGGGEQSVTRLCPMSARPLDSGAKEVRAVTPSSVTDRIVCRWRDRR